MISVSSDGKALSGTTVSNAAQTVTVTNTIKPVDLKLKKVETGTTTTLPGAQFKLCTDAAGNVLAKDLSGAEITPPITTGADGTVRINNLGPGTYYLIETKAPPGYDTLTEPITVKITKNGVQYNQPGNAASSGTNWLPRDNPGVDANPLYTLTVTNTRGHVLPSTGGAGTCPYRIGGAALLAAFAFLYTRKSLIQSTGRRKRQPMTGVGTPDP